MTAPAAIPTPGAKPIASNRPPLLENGDRLTRAEFERRFDAMPGLKKAELIEGVVHMPSPVRLLYHGQQHFFGITWLGTYCVQTPGVLGGDNTSVRLDMENEPQPDALLLIDPARGGQARLDLDGYIEGAPELALEISSSTVSYDMHGKFRVYRRNGVREYIVWRVLDRAVDWFVLRATEYERLQLDAAGVYRSEVFPGLWLDAAALIDGDMPQVQRVLQQGINSPEHAAFVGRLQSAKA